MSDGQAALAGPDLSNGTAAAELKEREPLLGHAGGEAVLLSRIGGTFHAIGATCTHYGGPLAEGLVVDGTVRCPWHHACFDLQTGEALRAPALKPLPCYRVEQSGDRVFVREKLPEQAPARQAPDGAPASVLIVGAGAAGAACAEALRREGYRGPVTLLGAEPDLPVDRPNLSKDYLAGKAPEDWMPLRDRAFYEAQDIRFQSGVRVTRLDLAQNKVELSDGTSLQFGALLLATGAEARRLPIPGMELPHVRTLRSWQDSRELIALLHKGRHAAVIGASFIGLEVAAALHQRGREVHVIAPEARPLERILGPRFGDAIRALHESHGVTFHLEQTPERIDASAVHLQSGASVAAALVVVGVGVAPATALAEQAGLAVDRGLLVDAHLRTSAPNIFAAGDLARFPDARSGERIRVEHWVVAQRMGQTAARNLLGKGEVFDAVPFFWSAHYDKSISYVGHAESWDRIDVAGSIEDWDAAVAYRKGDRTLAVATTGRDQVSLQAERALEKGDEQALAALIPRS